MKAPLFEKEGLGEIFLRYNFTHKVEFSSAKSPLSLFAKKGNFLLSNRIVHGNKLRAIWESGFNLNFVYHLSDAFHHIFNSE